MKILAIETSCDETSVAILENEKILSNIISTQINIHKKYGGVVPEIASRLHFENFGFVLQQALTKANVNIKDIDKIAYTKSPGLIGCLHIGKMIAKTLACYLEVELIPCNHLHGHIYSVAISNNIIFPTIALVVSGGHSQIYYLKKDLDFKIIGETLDDAVGEAFDKVSRMLGLGYPGGSAIQKQAKIGKPKIGFPIALNDESFNFSFSGLKVSVLNYINNNKNKNYFNISDICASFQETAVKNLMLKLKKAYKKFYPASIILAGGVSANELLRNEINNFCKKNKIKCLLPEQKYCTDNAAMIAILAYKKLSNCK